MVVLRKAMDALRPHRGAVLPLAAAEDLRDAFEALSDIEDHLPRIEAWCCWTERPMDRGLDRHVVWSAHFSEEVALRSLEGWKAMLSDRDDYVWHASLHACRVTDLVDPESGRMVMLRSPGVPIGKA
jgi:hypothetical protein